MTYIATFFSHFGAIRFKKHCDELGIEARTMPVPRSLSSSCGICTRFETDDCSKAGPWSDEVEKVVCVTDGGYKVLYQN
ncbi:MAG: DUF3343 domain-containing protein [Firmicutes bacterium]|nr:DUF3343 domain-containing protein [Bacillota bacterium]MBQ1523787.1 DUF3343 domain-containing protein [Bacillota bacterium]MBQ1887603.1 DUF3343 domain-containing protein [Bacillota bacterium]MBQ2456166.1 DUF3343 domain-containing protein [Bacillota bacterium]MBQ4234381.1 DUF3343 domain-containing protein [Bacillota bacterium]